jgi:hypothetical protein
MRALRVAAPLRDRLGHEATTGLLELVDTAQADWKEDVMTAAIDRFERRLTEEVSDLRVAIVRELHDSRVETLKWSFVFWIGEIAALTGVIATLFRATGR